MAGPPAEWPSECHGIIHKSRYVVKNRVMMNGSHHPVEGRYIQYESNAYQATICVPRCRCTCHTRQVRECAQSICGASW
jgi:hypothetical protein